MREQNHHLCAASALSPGQLASPQNTSPSRELSWWPRWVFYDHQVRRGPNSSVGTAAALFGGCVALSPSQRSQQSGRRSLGGAESDRPPPRTTRHGPRPPGRCPAEMWAAADPRRTKGLARQDVASHFWFKGSSLKRKKEGKKSALKGRKQVHPQTIYVK